MTEDTGFAEPQPPVPDPESEPLAEAEPATDAEPAPEPAEDVTEPPAEPAEGSTVNAAEAMPRPFIPDQGVADWLREAFSAVLDRLERGGL